MAGTHIHIVSLDVPWPPDYGGVIDVFHKVKALHGIGVHVHLHCFEYGRGKQKELDRYCTSVQYYKRQMGKLQLLSSLPYVVVSRRSDELVDRLLKDDHPILFEGLHSCYHLGDPRLHGRKRLVRAHNVEHDYYSALAKVESSPFKRSYFNSEAAKLKRYEPVLSEADAVLAISPKDAAYFNQHFRNVVHVPAFHACEKVDVPDGLGDFALYHGALGVADNNKAALWLLREVFNGLNVKLVIAGSDASSELKAEVAKHPNAELLEGISTERIHELVRTAQVHVLPTFQATGIKMCIRDIIGFQYTLPMLLVLDVRIDTDGQLRSQLMREDIPLTPRMRMDLMYNTDLEYMAGLRYVLDKTWAIRAHYDSDMGLGVGMTMSY